MRFLDHLVDPGRKSFRNWIAKRKPGGREKKDLGKAAES
jgi:hypothetical protein